MKLFYQFAGTAVLMTLIALSTSFGQGPGVAAGPQPAKSSAPQPIAPAPATFKAKYEGGVFGYNKKLNGTLTLDDVNTRLLFRNKEQINVLFIPYGAVVAAFGDKQARRPAAASVMSSVPVPYGLGLPFYFFKKKYQYLTLEYNDPDTKVSGVTSFKLENKDILASVLSSIANRAGLIQRGEVFVKAPVKAAPAAQPASP